MSSLDCTQALKPMDALDCAQALKPMDALKSIALLALVLACAGCFSKPQFHHNDTSRFSGCYRGPTNAGSMLTLILKQVPNEESGVDPSALVGCALIEGGATQNGTISGIVRMATPESVHEYEFADLMVLPMGGGAPLMWLAQRKPPGNLPATSVTITSPGGFGAADMELCNPVRECPTMEVAP